MNVNKRLLKEIKQLHIQQTSKPLIENDYYVTLDEANATKVYCLIKAPKDSVYRHTFVRLNMTIPDDYPHSPPTVEFVNYDGVRIHPNMYEDGKCCATILNTWPSDNERWTSSMGIETILLAFHSFLDNQPYTHEPGGRDDPSYTCYVRHQSFYTCLLRYLAFEKIQLFQDFMSMYLFNNIEEIFEDIGCLKNRYPAGYFYTSCFEIDAYHISYDQISNKLSGFFGLIEMPNDTAHLHIEIDDSIDSNSDADVDSDVVGTAVEQKDFSCNICFDTEKMGNVMRLNCNHTFHSLCIDRHITKNLPVCPICRQNVTTFKQTKYKKEFVWVLNPKTNKKIKVGGKMYTTLVEQGTIAAFVEQCD